MGPEEPTILSLADLDHRSTTPRLSRLEEGKGDPPQEKQEMGPSS